MVAAALWATYRLDRVAVAAVLRRMGIVAALLPARNLPSAFADLGVSRHRCLLLYLPAVVLLVALAILGLAAGVWVLADDARTRRLAILLGRYHDRPPGA